MAAILQNGHGFCKAIFTVMGWGEKEKREIEIKMYLMYNSMNFLINHDVLKETIVYEPLCSVD